ncbi:hypothetical protein LNKW23_14760 [Paralimibaculum aggregatum]|uniref:Uncharacterized protein n=1 Tax=Paralimibaculum aggregatum TaxID=3036245 RepID=A0ABQ6LG12_9RHOB|nr:hypothetical protein LNKW23_14760 [Limibaculum sp. NKW23]
MAEPPGGDTGRAAGQQGRRRDPGGRAGVSRLAGWQCRRADRAAILAERPGGNIGVVNPRKHWRVAGREH